MRMGGMSKVTSTPLMLLHFIQFCYGSFHLAQFSHLCFAPFNLPTLRAFLLSSLWFSFFSMPQEHGKPKRGPSWYYYASRQRCLRKLSQVSSTTLICGNKEPNSPPMAYVEEEIPKEPIMVFPDSILYTVADLQDRSNTSLPTTATTKAMEGETCIIQEEIPLVDCLIETPLPTSTMARDSHSPCFLAPKYI
jgi:hypothetical protein